jgi:predicted DNA-binding protein with PD1-like motif
MEVFVIRLLPGDNLQEKLVEFVKEKRLQNAFVITCVGSLTSAKIRLANADLTRDFSGHFEIVSLVGTIDPDGEHHLHISISDDKGNVFGGHVFSG